MASIHRVVVGGQWRPVGPLGNHRVVGGVVWLGVDSVAELWYTWRQQAVEVCVMRSSRTRKKLCGRVLLLPGFEWSPAGRGWCVAVPMAAVCVSAPVAAPAVSASRAGSRLFLESPEFRQAVAVGCPVRFLLGVFRWPVRSALVLCLCRVFLSGGGRLGVVSVAVRRRFLRACMSSLGYSVSGRASVAVCRSWLASRALKPDLVSRFHGVASVSGVEAGLSALAGGLEWLCSRGGGCPGAVRSALGLLGWLVAQSL